MTRAVAAVLWMAAAWFSLSTIILNNDHFGRISPARQIAVYGELPFKDFLDPGYFLTEFSSAAMQRLFGDNLLGEAILVTLFVASGTVLVFLLARRLTTSHFIGVVAAILALLMLPRAYDYDKVFFYPLGILLCWRYVDRRTAGNVVSLAVGLVAAALYRYDTGIYIGGMALVTMAVVHAGDWKTFWRRSGLLVAVSVGLSVPALVFLEYNGGLANVIDQVVTYGRRETARTQLSSPPSFTTSADAFLYYLVRTLPLLAAAVLILRARTPNAVSRAEAARVAGLVAMCVALNLFILRDPVSARFGGMAGPVAILGAWLVHQARRVQAPVARRGLTTVAAVALALTVWNTAVSADWSHRLRPEFARPIHVTGMMRLLAGSPPRLDMIEDRQFIQLVRYLRECTGPRDRVLATWFVPELYVFAQRGFAGGIVALFGDHWSEPRFEGRSLQILESQEVPVVIERAGDQSYRHSYPRLAQFLDDHYRNAGTTNFGVAGAMPGYTVYVQRDRPPSYVHQSSSLPCFW